jgi:hypothetical protein
MLTRPVPRSPEDRFSGNGGLSLRKVAAIRRILSFQARYNDSDPEDEWFGRRLWVLPGEKVAAGQEGVLAVEDVYMETPMGYHIRDGGSSLKDDVWRDHKQRKKIFDYCPELSLIMDMKLERERCEGDDREGVIHPTPEEIAEEKKQQEEERRKQEETRKKQAEEASRKAAAASSTRVTATAQSTDAGTEALVLAPPKTDAAAAPTATGVGGAAAVTQEPSAGETLHVLEADEDEDE